MPATSSPGFVIVDTAAYITSLSPQVDQTLIGMAKPMVELRLDLRNEEAPSKMLVGLVGGAEEMDIDEEEDEPPAADMDEDGNDDGPPVVSQQQLSRIFDVGPAFALPPIEEMFYQVAELFSSRATAHTV